MKRVSIKDVAEKAEVSKATVSLVLNGKEKEGRVSKEVADRVRGIAKELNYQPSALARGLQSGRTFIIGVIVADISNPFFGNLVYFIQDQMEKEGYSVMIMNTNEDDQHLEKIINVLRNHQVDGYIIVPPEHGEKSIRNLLESKIPLVLLDRTYMGLKTYGVMVDGYQASFEATSLLIEKGCKRIGLMLYESLHSHMAERKYGYMDALQRAGLYDHELIGYVKFNNLDKEIDREIARLLDNKIDGLLMATNSIAIYSIREMLKRRIKIPKQVNVISFDKSDAFEFMETLIPYVQQPIEQMARKAADLLLEQITGQESTIRVSRFPATLIQRG